MDVKSQLPTYSYPFSEVSPILIFSSFFLFSGGGGDSKLIHVLASMQNILFCILCTITLQKTCLITDVRQVSRSVDNVKLYLLLTITHTIYLYNLYIAVG